MPAPRKSAKAKGRPRTKEPAGRERQIEQYDHKGKERLNNPPVGLVTPETDPDTSRKAYAYDPHLDREAIDFYRHAHAWRTG